MLAELIPVRTWAAEALCHGRADDWVFDADQLNRVSERAKVAIAVDICHQCPVMLECRYDAILAPNPMSGAVAGGLDPSELHRARNQPDHIAARRFLNRPPCGTPKAYSIHLEFGEDCEECRESNTRRNNPENNGRGHP